MYLLLLMVFRAYNCTTFNHKKWASVSLNEHIIIYQPISTHTLGDEAISIYHPSYYQFSSVKYQNMEFCNKEHILNFFLSIYDN